MHRLAGAVDSPAPGPPAGPPARSGGEPDTIDRAVAATLAEPHGRPRRPGQPPEHWLRVVTAHAPGLLRDLALDPPPAGTYHHGPGFRESDGDGRSEECFADPAGEGGLDGPGRRPATTVEGAGRHAERPGAATGPDPTADAPTEHSPTSGPAPATHSPTSFALLHPTHHVTSGIRASTGAPIEAEQRDRSGMSRPVPATAAQHGSAGPGGPGGPVGSSGSSGSSIVRRRSTRGAVRAAGAAAAATTDAHDRAPASTQGPRPAEPVRGTTRAGFRTDAERPAAAPATAEPLPPAPTTRHTDPTSPYTGPASPPTGAAACPPVDAAGRPTGSAGRLSDVAGPGAAGPPGNSEPRPAAATPGHRAALRLVTGRQRTADPRLPDGDGWAGRPIGPGDGRWVPHGPPTGDGRWPGSGLPIGDGRWSVGADVRWPELESSRGGRTRPDPWPALPDDRALWSVPGPADGDEHRTRRLDGEQAGG
ncbi:hypothetical protein Vse01_06350 [Micromonospora sediminimaris]|uniref:Uncharacterized protein n=1 Tax=Micromonospora sediminimaris TaxID=547162 RepID=A0A9W5XI93_9ACTN|nr:hypothetical protein Vse01_06350 [Micromonospora sediminimaris]